MAKQVEYEMTVGDAIRIGEAIYTVIDIENGEVSIRVDHADAELSLPVQAPPAK